MHTHTSSADIVRQELVRCRQNLNKKRVGKFLGLSFEQCSEVFPADLYSSSEFFAQHFPYVKNQRLWEIGCGTGIVSVIAALRYGNRVVATDINAKALEMTQKNAKRHGVLEQIDCRLGTLFEPLKTNEKFDYIYWNWPYAYVTEDHPLSDALEQAYMDPGYHLIDRLLASHTNYLHPKGSLILSFGSIGNRTLFETLLKKHELRYTAFAEATMNNGRTYWLFQITS